MGGIENEGHQLVSGHTMSGRTGYTMGGGHAATEG
jgi:hypothetical protein